MESNAIMVIFKKTCSTPMCRCQCVAFTGLRLFYSRFKWKGKCVVGGGAMR